MQRCVMRGNGLQHQATLVGIRHERHVGLCGRTRRRVQVQHQIVRESR